MNRGQFFRSRGVAVSTGSCWEFDQDFAMQTDGPGFSDQHFLGNGIDQNEDGTPVFQSNWHAYGMEHFAPRWQQVELQVRSVLMLLQWQPSSPRAAGS